MKRQLVMAAIGLLAAASLPAQSGAFLGARVRADNDAFNFWLEPWFRPDEEYTSGVRGSLDYAGQAWWRRLAGGDAAPCGTGATRCAEYSYSFGQDIYTGAVGTGSADSTGARPNAGWLYLEEGERVMTATRLDEMSIAVGVTGSPSLASYVQHVAHGYVAAFNRPIDWSHQLPFEPGVVFRYEQARRLFALGSRAGASAGIEPHFGGALGTILIEGTAGIRARAGYAAAHPWLPEESSAVPSIEGMVDATYHGVARNEFLDGTLFRASDRVHRRPGVAEYQAGLAVRWLEASLSYRVHWVSPEYTERRDWHAWSSLEAQWRLSRR